MRKTSRCLKSKTAGPGELVDSPAEPVGSAEPVDSLAGPVALVELAALRRNPNLERGTNSELQASSDNPPGGYSIEVGFNPTHPNTERHLGASTGFLGLTKLYSYRRASVGLSCEARLAGSIPKITPTARETPNATKMDVTEIGTRMASVKNRTLSGIEMPTKMHPPPCAGRSRASARLP